MKELENYANDSARVDFTEKDIICRTDGIIKAFIDYMGHEKLFA